jgi:hypothetical protein
MNRALPIGDAVVAAALLLSSDKSFRPWLKLAGIALGEKVLPEYSTVPDDSTAYIMFT